MDKEIQYKTSETKRDWFSKYVLTKEQVAQLIENKLEQVLDFRSNNRQQSKTT